MSDLPRLRQSGSREDRALLAGALVPPLSEATRREIRHTLEDRLSPRGRRRAAARLAMTLAGTLVAGSALAYGVLQVQRHRDGGLPAPTPAPGPRLAVHPAAHQPDPPPAPPQTTTLAPAASRPALSAPPRRHASLRTPPAQPFGLPGLRSPQDLLAPPPPSDDESDQSIIAPLRPPPRLLIKRPGRRAVALVLAGDQIVGRVRDSAVALTVTSAQIFGKLGEHNVWLWLQGRQAKGTINDVPVRFEVLDGPGGQTLRAGHFPPGPLPAHSTRVTTTATSLAWYPGCDVPLVAARPGIYQGRCAGGTQAEVVIPHTWQQLPALTRLILLSFFLTERDGDLNDLFGRPDWAGRASVE
jgi:hypothetical protein